MENLTCDQAREALWPDPADTPDGPALRHYRACASCRQFFAMQERLGARLRQVQRQGIPQTADARLRRALAAVGRRRSWALIGTAAAAAVLATVFLWGLPANPAAPFAPAADHLVAMPMDSAPDLQQASGRVSQALTTPVTLPAIEGADFMGAHVLEVGGEMGAGAMYSYHGVMLAYFAVPKDGTRPDSAMQARTANGWEVAVWYEADGVRALAGQPPLTREEIVAMAHECRRKAAMMAARL